MARTKGMLNLSGNLEVNAQAPLDARTIVPTEADLTVASNFPYPYVGLEVYVTGTGKKFRLINLDTTQSNSWQEIGEGGGTGGGHTIQDDGTDMTARDNLNFVGMEVDDNDSDGSTDVTEHRLTSAEISEMMGGIPNPTPRYPIMFDERGTEYKVGWYILSDGTKKPVYRKELSLSSGHGEIAPNTWTDLMSVSIPIDKLIHAQVISGESSRPCPIYYLTVAYDIQNSKLITLHSRSIDVTISNNSFVVVNYTKTTDTPV